MFDGTLFTEGFLSEGIKQQDAWKRLDDASVAGIRSQINALFAAFPVKGKPTEAQTEKDLIWPLLEILGWRSDKILVQPNLSTKGRKQVPDALLFVDAADKVKANKEYEPWKRVRFGVCLVEAKRWRRVLDRRAVEEVDTEVPSTQMLRYMRRADDVTNGDLRWGILTNGRCWRLYFQGAMSVAEDFLEIDLGKVLDLPGCGRDLLDLKGPSADHLFKVFLLMFGRTAFLPVEHGRTFHDVARADGLRWEEKVAADLSEVHRMFFLPLCRCFRKPTRNATRP